MKNEITKKLVLEFIHASPVWKNEPHLQKRGVDIFFSDGYDSPSNRTAFFCVKGSPNKFYGYVSLECVGAHHFGLIMGSNYGNFYYNVNTKWIGRSACNRFYAQGPYLRG